MRPNLKSMPDLDKRTPDMNVPKNKTVSILGTFTPGLILKMSSTGSKLERISEYGG